MVKSFKKAIAVLVSVLMIATSLPFTALAAVDTSKENAVLSFDGFTANAKYTYNGTDLSNGYSEYYSNLIYDDGKFNDGTSYKNDNVYTKLFVNDNVVLMYDGKNSTILPVVTTLRKDVNNTGTNQKYVKGFFIKDSTTASYWELKENWLGSSMSWNSWPTTNSQSILFTDARSSQITLGDKNEHVFRNKLYFKGTGNTTDYYDAFTPSTKTITLTETHTRWGIGEGNRDNNYNDSNSNIYVINYKAVLDAVSEAKNIINNHSDFCDVKYATLVDKAYALTQINPNNYSYSSNVANAVSACATDIKNAINAFNTAKNDKSHNYNTVVKQSDTTHANVCDCGAVDSSSVTAHGWELKSSTAATCAVQSTENYECSTCHATKTEHATAATGSHTMAYTSNGDGTHNGLCSVCHEVSSQVTNETCTAGEPTDDGDYTVTNCTKCGAETSRAPKHVHTAGEWVTVTPATCVATGTKVKYCVAANCPEGNEYVMETDTIGVDADAHSFTIEQSSTTATCVTQGSVTYSCANGCSETYTEYGTIDADNHANIVTDNAVPATCTESGLTAGSHCEACSTTIVEQETVKALGHSFTNYVSNNDAVIAKCVTEGMTASQTATCDREGCEVTDTIDPTSTGFDADNHEGIIALDPTTVVEATAETEGYTGDKICDACNEVAEAGQVVPALGYTITFTGKTKVTHNFPVNTPAADVYAWAVANVEAKAPTSTSHYYWKEATFVDVTAAKSYSMTSYNHYNDLVITYEGDEATGVKINRTCETCGYTDQLDAVAKVGDKYFSAIKAATDACTSADDVVTIITDVTTAVANAITNSCTIDLNGKTITMTGSGAVFNITFNSSADPTVPTKVTFIDSVGGANVVATNTTSGMGISVAKPNVDVQINGGNYQSVTECVYVYPQYKKSLQYYDITGAIITVNDGTFASSASSKLTLNLNDNAREGNGIIVNGGTYSKFNPLGNVEIDVPSEKIVDDSVADQFTVIDGTDYYDANESAREEAAVLDEAAYTAESWADLAAALAETPARTTSAYDANTSAIETAITNLVPTTTDLTVTVNVEIDGSVAGTKTYTAEYGETVTIDLTDTLDGASIQKWTIEQDDATSKLSMANPVYDMVVTANATVTIIATANKTEDPSYTKVKFIDKAVRTIGYGYVMSTTEIDLESVAPIAGSNIVAPTLAFYDFAGWKKVSENVYIATYTVSATDLYEVEAGSENIKVNGLDKDYIDYDEKINVSYTGDKMLGMQVDGKIIPITDINNVHAPYGASDVNVKIIEIEESSLVPTSMITGKYTKPGDAGKTIAAFNAMFYLPEGYTLVECGVYAKKGESFTQEEVNTAFKVRSQSQSKNNEYTISLKSDYAALGVTSVYGMSYVTYKTADGTIETAYSDVTVINV